MAKDRSEDDQAPQPGEKSSTQKVKTYGVAFFETQQAALAGAAELAAKAARFGQLNVVIREEVKVIDPTLEKIAHVYCGPVWWQVHEHRVTESFYKE